MAEIKECPRCSNPVEVSGSTDATVGVPLCENCAGKESSPPPGGAPSIFSAIDSASKKKRARAKKKKVRRGESTGAPGRDAKRVPDIHLEIPTSGWSKKIIRKDKNKTAKRVRALLNGEAQGEPLLFRPWPKRKIWQRSLAVGVATTVLGAALVAFHISRPAFAFAGFFDLTLLMLLTLTVAGPITLIWWPIFQRYLQFRRGYKFGDYLFPAGVVTARSEKVVVHAWEHATASLPEGTGDPLDTFEIRTAGGDTLSLADDYEGDLEGAAKKIAEFDGKTMDGSLQDLQDDYKEPMLSMPSSDSVFNGFFVQLTSAVMGNIFFLTIPLTIGVAFMVQPDKVEAVLDSHDDMIAALLEHDVEGYDKFREFEDLCDRFGDGISRAARRLDEVVCDDLETTRILATFNMGEIHRFLRRPSIAYEEVLRERLEVVYEHRRERLKVDEDSEGLVKLADHLLRVAAQEPDGQVGLMIRPVISPRFEDYENLSKNWYGSMDLSQGTVEGLANLGVPQFFQSGDHFFLYRSALPYMHGRRGIERDLSVEVLFDAVQDAVFGHRDLSVEGETLERRYMYSKKNFGIDNGQLSYTQRDQLREEIRQFVAFTKGDGQFELQRQVRAEPVAREVVAEPSIEAPRAGESASGDMVEIDIESTGIHEAMHEAMMADFAEIDSLFDEELIGDVSAFGDLSAGLGGGPPVAPRRQEQGPINRDRGFFESFLSAPHVSEPTVVITLFAAPGEVIYETVDGPSFSSIEVRLVITWVEPSFGGSEQVFEAFVTSPRELEIPAEVSDDEVQKVYEFIAQQVAARLAEEMDEQVAVVEERLGRRR